MALSLAGAIPAYHFFAFDNCAYVILEYPTGRFHWLGFGKLNKVGTWTGGQFCFAKHAPTGINTEKTCGLFGQSYAGQGNSSGFLYVDTVDTVTGWARSSAQSASGNTLAQRVADTFQKMQSLWIVSPSVYNSLSILMPLGVTMTRDGANFGTTTPFSLMGYLSGLNFINIKSLTPGATYAVSTDTYRVFSFHEKVDEVPLSFPNFSVGNLGLALKTN
jgi:hypothetical protein